MVERQNHTLIEMIRLMINRTSLPDSFWGEALKTTIYILDRVLSKLVPKTPFEHFKGWKPNLNHL